MTSQLPADVRRALDRIATTGHTGRRPTAAHPHCTCSATDHPACPIHHPKETP